MLDLPRGLGAPRSVIDIWGRIMDNYECKHDKQPGTRPDFEALAAATASGPGDPSDRGTRLSCDGIDYTFDCAGGTI